MQLNDVESDCLERLLAWHYYCSPKGDREGILCNLDFIQSSRYIVPCSKFVYRKRYTKCYGWERLSWECTIMKKDGCVI